MNQKVLSLLTRALRNQRPDEDGLYVKTVGRLKREMPDDPKAPTHHCVMGVLADLAVKAGIVDEENAFGFSPSSLHPKIAEWAEINPDFKVVIPEEKVIPGSGYGSSSPHAVFRLNDFKYEGTPEYSFEDLADIVEYTYGEGGKAYEKEEVFAYNPAIHGLDEDYHDDEDDEDDYDD